MQNPHWNPWASRNASCTGCRVPSARISPSIVVISEPAACTASIRHDADGLAVEQHRAGAADAVLATDVGAREPEVLAEEVGEGAARLDLGRALGAVHRHLDFHQAATSAASVRTRRASTCATRRR